MRVLTTYENGRLMLFLKGELDHHGAKSAMRVIEGLLDEKLPRDCVLELSGLRFMDSSGIALILKVYKRLRETGGRIWVENAQPQPQRVIDASGIDRIVQIRQMIKE